MANTKEYWLNVLNRVIEFRNLAHREGWQGETFTEKRNELIYTLHSKYTLHNREDIHHAVFNEGKEPPTEDHLENIDDDGVPYNL